VVALDDGGYDAVVASTATSAMAGVVRAGFEVRTSSK
jgi:hypothetical protein